MNLKNKIKIHTETKKTLKKNIKKKKILYFNVKYIAAPKKIK